MARKARGGKEGKGRRQGRVREHWQGTTGMHGMAMGKEKGMVDGPTSSLFPLPSPASSLPGWLAAVAVARAAISIQHQHLFAG